MGKEVEHCNYVLASLYSLSGIATLCRIGFLYYKHKCSLSWYTQTFHGLLVLLDSIRALYLCLPVSVWIDIYYLNDGATLQTFLDLLPETCLLCIFLLMTVAWCQVFLKSRRIHLTRSDLWYFKKRNWKIAYALCCFLLLFCAGLLLIVVATKNYPYADAVKYQGRLVFSEIIICATVAALTIGIVLVNYRSNRMLSKQLGKLQKRLFAIIVTTCIGLLLKGFYVLIINEKLVELYRNDDLSDTSFALIWFFYYFLTELLPTTLLLVLLYFYANHIHKSSKSSMVVNQYSTGADNTQDDQNNDLLSVETNQESSMKVSLLSDHVSFEKHLSINDYSQTKI